MRNELENELPPAEPGARKPKKKADAEHLRRARGDLRGPGGPVAPVPPPKDDEPFNAPTTPWIGDVWVRKGGNPKTDLVDIVDVVEVGTITKVHYESRGLKREVKVMPMMGFLAVFAPDALISTRPEKKS